MKKLFASFKLIKIARRLLYLTALVFPVSFVTGSLVALFLWLLDWATAIRWMHMHLIFLLPLAGVFITYLYKTFGKNSGAGNNLIIDEIHEPGGGVPLRMTPLILVCTVITHLFGGSAGREGTAVQMGGSISAFFSNLYKLKHSEKRILLMCGIAAGFGAVFGTPVAGAVFAMEVAAIGRIRYEALLPCFIAAVLAHITCTFYGIKHTKYLISFIAGTKPWLPHINFDFALLFKVIAAGITFGLTAYLFIKAADFIKGVSAKYICNVWLIPVAGGLTVVAISCALGTFNYLGLGVTNPAGGVSIVSAFKPGGAQLLSWFWKLLLTVITLSTGFKGGEVTPLFFIGATLGNILAVISGAPVDLFAGLGFIAVFAGAANTPLACTLMGVELFGSTNLIYYAVACFTAYYFSGHTGIYHSQKTFVSRFNSIEK